MLAQEKKISFHLFLIFHFFFVYSQGKKAKIFIFMHCFLLWPAPLFQGGHAQYGMPPVHLQPWMLLATPHTWFVLSCALHILLVRGSLHRNVLPEPAGPPVD
jgi:hypothetical protein